MPIDKMTIDKMSLDTHPRFLVETISISFNFVHDKIEQNETNNFKNVSFPRSKVIHFSNGQFCQLENGGKKQIPV